MSCGEGAVLADRLGPALEVRGAQEFVELDIDKVGVGEPACAVGEGVLARLGHEVDVCAAVVAVLPHDALCCLRRCLSIASTCATMPPLLGGGMPRNVFPPKVVTNGFNSCTRNAAEVFEREFAAILVHRVHHAVGVSPL